jgi:hypothetical protein
MDPLLTGDKHPAVEPDGDVGFVFELIVMGGGDFGVLVEVAEKDVLGYCWELWAVLCHRGCSSSPYLGHFVVLTMGPTSTPLLLINPRRAKMHHRPVGWDG